MPDFGFPKKLRLSSSAEFQRVFKNASYRVSCRYILVLAVKNDLAHPRLGLVIGKKHASKAVQRNLIKRVLRNSFRLNQDLLPSVDIVILARSNVCSLDKTELSYWIGKMWESLNKKHAASDISNIPGDRAP